MSLFKNPLWKFFFAFSFCFNAPTFLFCQTPDDNLEASVAALEQDLSDSKLEAAARFGLAQIYANNTFADYDLDKAWTLLLESDALLKAMSDKKKKKYVEKHNLKIARLKNQVSEAAFDFYNQKNTVEGYDHFLTFYKKSRSKYKSAITVKRNQIAYDDAIKLNSSKAFEDLLAKYGKSLKSRNPALYKASELKMFEMFIEENGWENFSDFEKKHPSNPYIRDRSSSDFLAVRNSNKTTAFQEFLDQSPNSLYKNYALDRLSLLIMKNQSLVEYNWFLRSFPTAPAARKLWGRYYILYLTAHGEASMVDFAEEYPQYPFQDDLQADLKIFREASLASTVAYLQASGDVDAILNFIEKNPNHDLSAQLEKGLLENLRKNPTIYNYERFLMLTPSPELIPALISDLYELYSFDLDMNKIQQFQENYNDFFPDTERVNRDVQLAQQKLNLRLDQPFEESKISKFDQFIKDAAPNWAAYQALFKMMQSDLQSKNWNAASQKMKQYENYFLEAPDQLVSGTTAYQQLFDALQRDPQKVYIAKLDNNINTEANEYAPMISANGKTLYFCAKERADNLGREDIYFSKKENGQWSPAQLVADINTIHNSEAPEAISVDGTQMLLFQGGKLVATNQTPTGWSELTPLPDNINATKWQADASISSDGKAILFSSKRRNIVGSFSDRRNMDIYVCLKNEYDEWDRVINLGNTINTPYMDRSPFLHPDMKTLYFSSSGQGGFGGMDVYKTTRLDDTWMNWSTPINLGKEINTSGGDWGYKVSTDGKTAYFSYSKPGARNEDIYQAQLPESMRPGEVSTISGVLKGTNGIPIEASVVIEDLATGEKVAELKSNPQTGEFFAVLPDNRKYSYYIKKENYFPISNNIDLTNNNSLDITEDLEMFTVNELAEKGTKITLENIFFDTDKFELQPESYLELDRVMEIIKAKNFKVELGGHTDNVGAEDYNRTLSQNRADAVRSYLIKKGMSPDKVSAKGFGESQPIETNQTEQGKAKNRRVEVRFIN